ncbi:MAG: rhomboid family intramembrane serine protease [Candidatus Woesearchaeota archaeon]
MDFILKSIFNVLNQPIFLIFPLLLILLFYIPNESVKFILKLNVSKPEIWQFFTSSFIHENVNHLFSNLKYYFLIVFALSFIYYKLEEIKVLSKLFFLLILSYWFIEVIFFLILKFNSNATIISCGSSGIVFALFGVFFSSILYYISKEKKHNFMKFNLYNLVLISIFFVIFYSYGLYLNKYIDYFSFSFFVILIFIFLLILFLFSKIHREDFKKIKYLIGLILVLHFIVFLFLFPTIDKALDLGINISSHFIGYVLGLIISGYYLDKILKKNLIQK